MDGLTALGVCWGMGCLADQGEGFCPLAACFGDAPRVRRECRPCGIQTLACLFQLWRLVREPAGAFRPAPGVPFVLPKGTKSAPPASAPLRGSLRCSQAQARPKLTPLASLVPFKQLGGVRSGGGLAPAPGLAVLLSASGRGNSRTASSQQPGNGAVIEVRGCSAVGCWLFVLAVSAICTPPKRTATRGLAPASINN